MTPQTLANAVAVLLSAYTRLYVVIHFYVANAVFRNEPVYYLVSVSTDFRIPEIKLITASVIDSLAVTCEEPTVIANAVHKRTLYSHDLYFKPKPRYHALFADIVGNFLYAVRKTLSAFLPFADLVPPKAVSIPACVNAEIFTACLCRSVHKGKLLFSRRVAPQTVHVVVEYYRKPLIVLVAAAYLSAVFRQLAHSFVKASCHRAYCTFHAFYALVRCKIFVPVGLYLRRTRKL